MAAKATSESSREREALRYYNIYNIQRRLDQTALLSPQRLPRSPQPDALPSRDPVASNDPILTSLAQLAAFRLNARRALISLFDRSYQYVIAEGTRSQALRPKSEFVPQGGDELWLAGTAIPRSFGICEHVILANSGDSAGFGRTGLVGVSVVPDLAADDRFSNRPFITSFPYNRFYAGAPITTSRGISIGALCVFDTEPRPNSLDPAETEYMVDLAQSIMQHLEANRLRAQSRRNERMVRGIGSFVEGSSTLAGWWSNVDQTSYHGIEGDEGNLDSKQQKLAQLEPIDMESGREMAQKSAQETQQQRARARQKDEIKSMAMTAEKPQRRLLPRPMAPAKVGKLLSKKSYTENMQLIFAKAANVIRESIEVEGIVFFDARPSSFGGMVDDQKSETSGSDEPTAQRSVGIPNGMDEAQASLNDQPCKMLAFSTSEGSSINDKLIAQQFPVFESFLNVLMQRYPRGKIFSFDETGLLQSSESEGSEGRVDQAEIDALLAEPSAPGDSDSSGGEFSTATSSAPKARKRFPKRHSRVNDATSIITVFPGARSVMFLPVWDSHRERWFAGAMAWTRQIDRPFSTRGDLSYLSAFGVTIMSQIATLDALTADKSKTDLLGSVSHELRSPLHGVLGGVEMLSDTTIDAFQSDVLHTIEACGETLLDTIDHLLDYAKVNNFMRANQHQRPSKHSLPGGSLASQIPGQENSGWGMMSLSADVELDRLVEDVVESVYAGHNFILQSSAPFDGNGDRRESSLQGSLTNTPLDTLVNGLDWSGPVEGTSTSGSIFKPLRFDLPPSSNVAVVLDIQNLNKQTLAVADDGPRGWLFNTQPGALRRILMNLFGNSLKYTSSGLVRISLSRAGPTPPGPPNSRSGSPARIPRRSDIVLTVSDTGKGMSPDYLENHIFVPFSQEDRLAPGTGLGLSLVRHIVLSLDGTIDVKSKIGVGTTIAIRLPLLEVEQPSSSGSSGKFLESSPFMDLQQTNGLCVALIGFWEPTGDSTSRGGKRSSWNNADLREMRDGNNETSWPLPRRDVENLCRERLGVQVLPPIEFTEHSTADFLSQLSPHPDILLVTESGAEQLLKVVSSPHASQTDRIEMAHKLPPVIVVCRNMMIAKLRSKEFNDQPIVMEWISQPCGPRKLAKSFVLGLERWSERKSRQIESQTPKPSLSTSESLFQHQDAISFPFTAVKPVVPDSSFHNGDTGNESASQTPTLSSVTGDVAAEAVKNRFLLVDDNHINMRILVAFMKKKGYIYHTAENGLIALELFKENQGRYRCVLMDISMPVMDGIESSRHIRAYESKYNIHPVTIVALTGLASENIRRDAFASGVNVFMTKPVRLKELGEVIETKAFERERS